MESIRVEDIGSGKFRITVGNKDNNTQHTVSLSEKYYQQLTGGKVSREELVRHSFVFLLSREPKESILSDFDLGLIQKYFPDYESTISKALT